MLDNKGFDLWTDDYDKSVGLSDEDGSYPFAGYKAVLNAIYNRILSAKAYKVLDIGFGTATLTAKLYEKGCNIYGQDFSERMMELAQEKMPDAKLYQGDFSKGLVEPLKQQKYDAIIATYSLHHLTDSQKVDFLRELLKYLEEDGCIYIGDVAFETRTMLEECKAVYGDEWDTDEIYFVYEELKKAFLQIRFEQMSSCAGLLVLKKQRRIIKSMEPKYLLPAARLVEEVFTEYENEKEGKLVRRLVEEIRSKKYYIPELELVMVDEMEEPIGYAMFSRFHIEGKYEDELLLLSPVAVKTALQRQHISKEILEYGFEIAKKMGFKAVMVEGNPRNYNARGFDSSYKYGVEAGPKIHLPRPECLMLKELEEGALEHISGIVDYSFYETLNE